MSLELNYYFSRFFVTRKIKHIDVTSVYKTSLYARLINSNKIINNSLTKSLLGGLQIYEPYMWTVVASIARKNPYFVEKLNNEDILDLKKLLSDFKFTNAVKDTDGKQV